MIPWLLVVVLVVQLVQLVYLVYLLKAKSEGGGAKPAANPDIYSIVPPLTPQNISQKGSIHFVDDDLEAIAVREGKAVDDEFFDVPTGGKGI